MQVLSVLIPAYNEAATVEAILTKVAEAKLFPEISLELIIVNDASSDGTEQRVADWISANPQVRARLVSHSKNRGKGAAIRTGIETATGDFIIVQDADLEYDPNEFTLLLNPILQCHADVVYGSRFMGGKPHRVLFFWHTIGNKFLTFISNMFSNLNLTDMETCYKMFRTEKLKSVSLQENRFGFEPEVTAKIARIPGIRIYEVGISYYGRTYAEGKKINWKDGFRAIWCILKYGAFKG